MEYRELKRIFQELKRTSPREDLTAHIIFTEDSFAKEYPLLSRTYRFDSDNKAFWPSMGGYSIFAYCLDAVTISRAERTEQGDGTVCYFFGDTCIRVRESRKNGKIKLEPVRGDQVGGGEWVELSIDRVYGYCTLLERHLNRKDRNPK